MKRRDALKKVGLIAAVLSIGRILVMVRAKVDENLATHDDFITMDDMDTVAVTSYSIDLSSISELDITYDGETITLSGKEIFEALK